jgi:hypothetical protein
MVSQGSNLNYSLKDCEHFYDNSIKAAAQKASMFHEQTGSLYYCVSLPFCQCLGKARDNLGGRSLVSAIDCRGS